ncbi:unnamed protein product [Closterium sp. Naga37s-1]|nr:unnamed protein product [Closterium sp. Naga37s-1]
MKVPYTIKFGDVSKSFYILNYLANSVCKSDRGGSADRALQPDVVPHGSFAATHLHAPGFLFFVSLLSPLSPHLHSHFSSPSLPFLLPLTPIHPPPHSHSSSPSLPFLLLSPIPPPSQSSSSSLPVVLFLYPIPPLPLSHSSLPSSPSLHSPSPSLPFLHHLTPISPPPHSHFFTPSLPFLPPAPLVSDCQVPFVTVSHLFTALHSHTFSDHLSTMLSSPCSHFSSMTGAVATVSRLFTALLVLASVFACAL